MSDLILLDRLHPAAELPKVATPGSYGYDLSTVEPTTLGSHTTQLVPTGWRLAKPLPRTYAMLILPRSSLILKHELLIGNAPGLIDSDYTGEIKLVVHNLADHTVFLDAGTRLAQLLFVAVHMPSVLEADVAVAFTQERGGFGSTG